MYYTKNTISGLKKLIILENFFCINRSYLIDSSKCQFFCNTIFFFMLSAVFGASAHDFYFYTTQLSISMICLQVVVATEIVYLSIAARYKNSLDSMTRLDEKCGVDAEYMKTIEATVTKTVCIGVVSSILDVTGAFFVISKVSIVITMCIVTGAHDAEMAFYSMLYKGINLRLAVIEKMSILTGWKIYRHVLITALNLSEEFTAGILLMLASTLLTTVIYAVILIVSDPEMIVPLAVVLVWRQLKALYSLWVLCATAAETKTICDHLSFVLATRLALYYKGPKSAQHKATRQLLSYLKVQRPRYLSGMILTVDLGLPLELIDLSVNYLLIIVQIYIAFK